MFVTHQLLIADDRAGAGIKTDLGFVRTRVSPRGHVVAHSAEDQFRPPIPGAGLAPERPVDRDICKRGDTTRVVTLGRFGCE